MKNILGLLLSFFKCVLFIVLLVSSFHVVAQNMEVVTIKDLGGQVSIENEFLVLTFSNQSGTFQAINKKNNIQALTDAYFQIHHYSSNNPACKRSWSQKQVNDKIGNGKQLLFQSEIKGHCAIILGATLYPGKPFIVFSPGLKNESDQPIQCKSITPFVGKAFKGIETNEGFFTLDGNGGGEKTEVSSRKNRNCRNNLFTTFGKGTNRRSIVFGGLTYHEFEKFVTLQQENNELQVSLSGYDPIGKRVDPGQTYFPDDKFYIDFVTVNPFESLENYALNIRKEQEIELSQYEFPTVCLWYAGAKNYGDGPENNNSKGAVEEAKYIAESGFLNYSKAAVRLVPDSYDANNQQGWWDDEHFQKISSTSSNKKTCYVAPFETTGKWGKEVQKLGVIPLLYSQTARRSEDYCILHPEQMLFNQSHLRSTNRTLTHEAWWWGTTEPLIWSYDFTDPGFVKHMNEVYTNFRSGGIKGLMFDYPSTAWNYEGGFENSYATTASAYRDVFRLASEGLGPVSFIDERNLERGSDITLGVVTSQRAWGDTDLENPLLVSRGGLRWYKNRVVVNYDLDAKNPNHCIPDNRDGERSMLTMSYVSTGRLVLGISFSQLTKEQFYDITRVYPFHNQARSARPLDAFSGKRYPEIYDFEINPGWHQLTLYNSALDNYEVEYPWYGNSDGQLKGKPIPSSIEVDLGKPQADGGLGLDNAKSYFLYDFWNNTFLGKFSGNDLLKQDLRAGEARMISVHESENNPQFLSTNRHIMQGYLDMVSCSWDIKANVLTGKSMTVAGEPYKVVIAGNGYIPKKCKLSTGKVKIASQSNDLFEIEIKTSKNECVEWELKFDKN